MNYCSCWLSKLVSLSLSIAFFLICVSFVGKPANRFYGLAKVLPKFSAAATDYGHDSGNRLSGWAWAGDGCSTAGTAHKWTELDTSLSASVRCCSVGGIEVTCDSDPSGTCLPAVATYAEAEQACAAAGMRLCTRGEIEDDICCGTGCGYDGHVVWTSSGSQGLSLSLSLCVSSCCVWHTHSCAYAFVCVGSNVFSSLYVCVYVCPLIKCAAHLRVANGERVATHHASSGSWH